MTIAMLLGLPAIAAASAATGASHAAGRSASDGRLIAPLTCPSSSERCIFVSPAGSDADPGTAGRPIRSLGHARDMVRGFDRHMTGDITIYLENGTYRLAAPLLLGPRDSGRDGHNVVWTSEAGASAVISGAKRIFGWKLTDPSKNIWAARVPRTLRTRQIYVNGMRAWLASGPPPVKLTRYWTGYKAASPVMAHWRNPGDIDFVYTSQLGDAVEPRCPVGSIRGEMITMAQPCWYNSNLRRGNIVGFGTLQSPTYIENAYELLHQPGQFYLDDQAHKLYYIPRAGQNMRTADVEAPRLQTLVEGTGTAAHSIHNILFENLQFSYATWLQPGTPEGFSEIQSGYTVTGKHGYATEGLCTLVPHGTCPYGAWTKEPGNLQFGYDHDLSFLGDRFVHLGAAGLNFDDGSQNDTVAGSIFTDISGNGIEVGSVDMPQATGAYQTTNITLTNNHLYGMPVEYHGGVAILVGYAADSLISHNQIDHTPYIPISMGWGGWLDKILQPSVPNFSHDNVISDNLLFDFMQSVSDGGGVYTQGITGSSMAGGEKVTGNVIHDQLDWGSALKSDDGGAYVTYAGNILYDDIYDWSGVHYDYRVRPGVRPCTISSAAATIVASSTRRQSSPRDKATRCFFDPELVKDNWWQQGDPDYARDGIVETGNTIIAGPQDAPASVVADAGIEPQYRPILSWRPFGDLFPAAPERVSAMYALDGRAYVTWHPSFASGNDPVLSYTVTACPAVGSPDRANCTQSVALSAVDLAEFGYAVVSGLTDGKAYTATVTAHTASGSSAPSIPSPVFTPRRGMPPLPGRPTRVGVRAGRGIVRLLWYRPRNDRGVRALVATPSSHHPVPVPTTGPRLLVLRYIVTSSTGETNDVTGHMNLISTNKGGRVLDLIGGLPSGRRYRFSIAAVNPAGTGPAITTPWVTTR